jgi:hypothetical protein
VSDLGVCVSVKSGEPTAASASGGADGQPNRQSSTPLITLSAPSMWALHWECRSWTLLLEVWNFAMLVSLI